MQIRHPQSILCSQPATTFVKGNQTNFEIGHDGVEASKLYP